MKETMVTGSVYLEQVLLKQGGEARLEWKMLTAGWAAYEAPTLVVGKAYGGTQHQVFLLNNTVRIYVSEETMDGLLEYQTKKELHVHLEGSGEFILKVKEQK